jgi:hypothetical protein
MTERTQPQTIKERLKGYTAMLREIDNQIERLERMESTMTSASSSNLSGMPKSPGVKTDRTAMIVIRKMELEGTIKEAIEAERTERAAIELLLQQVKKPDERAVIRLRYFDRAGWPEICGILFGEADDFEDATENYMRKTFRLHGTALISLAEAAGEADEGNHTPKDAKPSQGLTGAQERG